MAIFLSNGYNKGMVRVNRFDELEAQFYEAK